MCENAVMLKPCGLPFQHPYPIRTQSSKQTGSRVHARDDNEKRGFTLIELLVVILIIGILAAVALPQYQVAVNKSRLMKGVALARPYLDAEEAYKLANGAYTHRMAELDLACPFANYEEDPDPVISLCSDGAGHTLMLANSYLKYSFRKNYQDIVGFDWNYSTRVLSCFSAVESGKKACKSLGGVENERGYFEIQM